MTSGIDLRSFIRDVPDFPSPGILFKDITPMLGDGAALRAALDLLVERVAPLGADTVVGIESRGFVFGAPLADRLGLGFVPVRKPGKLPYRCIRDDYTLEYGKNVLEMHEDAVPGRKVVIIDDLLATGGTAITARLCHRQGAQVVGYAFVIELTFLKGRQALGEFPVETLLSY